MKIPHAVQKVFSEQTIRYLIISVFIGVISYQVAGIGYKLASLYLVSKTSNFPEISTGITYLAEKQNLLALKKIIEEKNLFASAKEPLSTEKALSYFEEKEKTSSRWELKGTIVFNNFFGYAILSEKANGTQRLMSTGKKWEGVTLLKVGRDFCVLEEEGKQYVLRNLGTKLAPLIPGEKGGGESIIISRKDVLTHISNLGQLLNEAKVVPFTVNGIPAGFQFIQILPGSLFQKLGLVAGDIVQEVNQKKVLGAEDMTGLFQTLQTASSMTITILRGGKVEKLQYQFI